MNFPLLQRIPSVVTLDIPRDRYVLSLDGLTREDINDLQWAFFSMIGSDSSRDKYITLDYIRDRVKSVYERLSDYDIIVAPGDSPAKHVNVFRLCGYDVSKFVQFPVSGLGEIGGITDEMQDTLDEYIALVMAGRELPEGGAIALFDYVSSGASTQYMLKSLSKLYPKDSIDIIKIQEDRRDANMKVYDTFYRLMVEGEPHNSRTVRRYPITDFEGVLPSLEAPNLWKSNLICMIVALHCNWKLLEMHNRREVGIDIDLPKLEIDGMYKCSYYDFESGEIRHDVIRVVSRELAKIAQKEIKLASVLQITSRV